MQTSRNAYVLRQKPGTIDQLHSISIPEKVLVNGWSGVTDLIDCIDKWEMRERMKAVCYPTHKNYRKAGYAAGVMWIFLKEMKSGDLVVVPDGRRGFYVAEILGEPYFDDSPAAHATDSCYRRPAAWLNAGEPIVRHLAHSKLFKRMKTKSTCVRATDLLDDIDYSLSFAENNRSSNITPIPEEVFIEELTEQLIRTIRSTLDTKTMNDVLFEKLVAKFMMAVGAESSQIIPRRNDKGVDVVAEFILGSLTRVKVGVSSVPTFV